MSYIDNGMLGQLFSDYDFVVLESCVTLIYSLDIATTIFISDSKESKDEKLFLLILNIIAFIVICYMTTTLLKFY